MYSKHATAISFVALSVLTGALCLAGCSSNSGSGGTTTSPAAASGGKVLQIAVIPKGTSHDYWKSIHAGALKAQQDEASKGININILWQGPVNEDDRNQQINIVQTFVSKQVDAIVLAPLDSQALVAPVHDATEAKIPVVIMDSGLNGKDPKSFVASDNEKGGFLAGQELLKDLGGKGRLLMMRYEEGSASTEAREKGFLSAVSGKPGVTIVSDDQYGGATIETASKSAQNLLNRYGTQIDGIFCPNESTACGMLDALKDAGSSIKVKFVGFDNDDALITALNKGQIQALAVQNPLNMGYMGVETAVDVVKGKAVPSYIDTGVTIVTKSNMDLPANHDLLYPPVDKYLK
jgi:ribose transport system substrate-binding protein